MHGLLLVNRFNRNPRLIEHELSHSHTENRWERVSAGVARICGHGGRTVVLGPLPGSPRSVRTDPAVRKWAVSRAVGVAVDAAVR